MKTILTILLALVSLISVGQINGLGTFYAPEISATGKITTPEIYFENTLKSTWIGAGQNRIEHASGRNTAIGYGALGAGANTNKQYNSAFGYMAGSGCRGANNVFFGYLCGNNNTDGDNNVYIGYAGGWTMTTGDNNIFIGNNSGQTGLGLLSGTSSNRFQIANSTTLASVLMNFDIAADTGSIYASTRIKGDFTVTGTMQSTGYLLNENPHAFFSKRDTSGFTLALEQWGWKSFTGLSDIESYQVERLTNDTMQYQGTRNCHMDIKVNMNATTSSANDDVWLRVVNVRTGFITYGMALSGGANNYSSWKIIEYDVDCQPLDKYVIQARNKTNGNDLTIYSVTIDITVNHFE